MNEEVRLPVPAAAPGPSAVVLTCAEVHELLSRYTGGMLNTQQERAVDAHLETCAACARELRSLRQEDTLLAEALAGLKPTESFRARVSLMAEIRRQAEAMADSLPQRGWTIFRWLFAAGAGLYFVLVAHYFNEPAMPETFTGNVLPEGGYAQLPWVNLTIFALAIFLLLGSRQVAKVESYLSARLGGRLDTGPSRLEILTLEALGLCGIIAAGVFHLLYRV